MPEYNVQDVVEAFDLNGTEGVSRHMGDKLVTDYSLRSGVVVSLLSRPDAWSDSLDGSIVETDTFVYIPSADSRIRDELERLTPGEATKLAHETFAGATLPAGLGAIVTHEYDEGFDVDQAAKDLHAMEESVQSYRAKVTEATSAQTPSEGGSRFPAPTGRASILIRRQATRRRQSGWHPRRG